MREIKFRAWDFIENMMMDDSELSYGIQYNKNKVEIISQKDCFVFLQYTGLKDKNGVEIYEGNIIKYDFNKLNYRIEFVNAEFIARRFYENIENLYPTEFDYGKECEVIGNIYENPELLEGTK